MSINFIPRLTVEARDIEKAFYEKYNKNINAGLLLLGEGYANDSYYPIDIEDIYKDAIWDYKLDHNLAHYSGDPNDDGWEYEYDRAEINLNEVEACKEKDVILVCMMLKEYLPDTNSILLGISW